MDFIKFSNKDYPIRTFKVMIEGQEQIIKISTNDLYIDLGGDRLLYGSNASNIDDSIFRYVESELIKIDAMELCQKCFNIEFEFIEEL
jgi:hypothetical protein